MKAAEKRASALKTFSRRCRSYQMKIVFMTCYNGDTHKSLPEYAEYIEFRDARDKR
jgi:hypothetical protein